MFSPDGTHLALLRKKPQLAFDETKDFATQQKAIKEKLVELLGHRPEPVPLNPLVVANGKKDPIFPDNGVKETYETIQKVYAAAGVPDKCALATGDGGHRYYKQEAWEAFDRLVNWD